MTVPTYPPFADQRVLVGAPATVAVKFRDQYGEATQRGTVNVSIVDATGAEVVSSTGATWDSTNSQYTASISSLTDLAFLTATWADSTNTATSTIEVVSGYYFSIADVRAYKNGIMADAGTYPTALIRSARDEVEREFERVCWPFLPRYRRVELPAAFCRTISLPDMHIRRVRSVTEYDTTGTQTGTWTAAELAGIYVDASGLIDSQQRVFGWNYGTVAIEYEYGFDRPPADVLEAAFRRLRHKMNADKSGIPDRAVSYTHDGGGSYSLSTPGRNGAVTGMPDVDAVLMDPRYRRPLVGVG